MTLALVLKMVLGSRHNDKNWESIAIVQKVIEWLVPQSGGKDVMVGDWNGVYLEIKVT
jgi:hypothetical protein